MRYTPTSEIRNIKHVLILCKCGFMCVCVCVLCCTSGCRSVVYKYSAVSWVTFTSWSPHNSPEDATDDHSPLSDLGLATSWSVNYYWCNPSSVVLLPKSRRQLPLSSQTSLIHGRCPISNRDLYGFSSTNITTTTTTTTTTPITKSTPNSSILIR